MNSQQDDTKNTNKSRKHGKQRSRRKRKSNTGSSDNEVFSESKILKNFGVCQVIMELVNVFTSNLSLPKNELMILKLSLIKKVAVVIANLLNTLLDQVKKEVFQNLKRNPVVGGEKPVMVNSCCQTDKVTFIEQINET